MLSRRTETSRITLFLLDQILVGLAFVAAIGLRELFGGQGPEPSVFLSLYAVAAPSVAVVLACCGYYNPRLEQEPPTQGTSRELLMGGFLVMVVVMGTGFVFDPSGLAGHPAFSRAVPLLFLGTASVALWLSRLLVTVANRQLADDPGHSSKLLVFGLSQRMLKLLATFQRAPHTHMSLLGVAADVVPSDVGPRLTTAEALEWLEQGRADHVLVEASRLDRDLLDHVFEVADREGVSVHITSSFFPSTTLVPTWERVGGVPLLGFVSAELPLGARAAKRSFDVVVSAALLLLLALPMLIISAIVRLTSSGSAVLVQQRVGEHGHTFPMLKFRTMVADAEAGTGPVMATSDDPRCTAFGRLLRRTNLDELPQLANVLMGHMSLVGPRPERPEFVGRFKEDIPRYAHKHWVKPGITGWAQIHGLRGSGTSLDDRVEHDIYYIENWSLLLDIRILVRTLFDGYLNAA